jgi:branched-chain amino acid transport system permease protein
MILFNEGAGKPGHKWISVIAIIASIGLLPFLFNNPYTMSVLIFALLYAYFALSWNIVGGIAGQLSLGHSVYAGIGAYTSTVLFLQYGLSPWIGMTIGAALAALAAILIGFPCFKLRGAYFALATLAFAMIMKIIVENTHNWLGGPRGLEITLLKNAPWQFQHTSKLFYYGVAVIMILVVIVCTRWILRSRVGYYLNAIKNDQEAAQSLGINVTYLKLTAAVISAAFTSIGGTFYAQFVLYINPEKIMGSHLSIQLAVMCIIGGRGTIMGPILGAILLMASEEITRLYFAGKIVGIDLMLYGIILMVVIRFVPQGIYFPIQGLFSKVFGNRPAQKKISLVDKTQ